MGVAGCVAGLTNRLGVLASVNRSIAYDSYIGPPAIWK